MKNTDIKKGMKIRILKEPKLWRSQLSTKCPLNKALQYPWEGIVEESNDLAACISGYGFDIEEIKEFEIIDTYYQIY